MDAAADLINMLLDGKGYTFDFLMENLWWPGNLTFEFITKSRQQHESFLDIQYDTLQGKAGSE